MRHYEVTEENIVQVDSIDAFEWVKLGVWDLHKFQMWYFKSLVTHADIVLEAVIEKARGKKS